MWFMVKNLYQEQYTPSWLAEFVHKWPHISYKTFAIAFKDATFAPYDEKYVETLLFWAGIPIVWLGVCIIALLLFSFCLCMKRNQPVSVRKGIIRLRWWVIATMLLCIAAIGVSLYGNSMTASGVHHYKNAVRQVNITMNNIDHEVAAIQGDMMSASSLADEIKAHLEDCTANTSLIDTLQELKLATMQIDGNISEVGEKLGGDLVANLVKSSESVSHYHLVGWSIFIGLLLLDSVLCMTVILCTGRSIRGGIIFCCILLIIAFTMVWVLAGAELFVTMGLSDFCVKPSAYIIYQGNNHDIDTDVLNYYLNCTEEVVDPFQQVFTNSQRLFHEAQNDKDTINSLCKDSSTVQADLDELEDYFELFQKDLNDLKYNANCDQLNKDYKLAIFGLCYNSLYGLGYQVLSGVILGMLWLIAICQGTLLASRLGRRKMNYDADQEDPFLPPRDGSATLERYSARREQASTSGLGRRPISSASQRGSSLISQSNVTVPDDLPPSYTLAISRDRPNQRGGSRSATDSSDNRYSAASLV